MTGGWQKKKISLKFLGLNRILAKTKQTVPRTAAKTQKGKAAVGVCLWGSHPCWALGMLQGTDKHSCALMG